MPGEGRIIAVDAGEVLLEHAGVRVLHGGYGSAIAPDPLVPGAFYLLTDRGPNFDVPDPGMKGFAFPTFVPHIGRFERRGDVMARTAVIPFRHADGALASGLPIPAGIGSTAETPVALDGRLLPFDARGIDPEGLAAMPDGTFWVSEEYGPSLLHVAADGVILERVSPAPGGRSLPRVFARRWPNRGLEAVAAMPDGRTLVTITQSALDNPSPGSGARSRVVRILLFDTASGATRQYLYLQDAPGLSTSALAAVSGDTLLVVEHDKRFTSHPTHPSTVKFVYRVSLAGATDVGGDAGAPAGTLVDRCPLELLDVGELGEAGIRPVSKVRVLDLIEARYPHDKPEGIALLDDGATLAVLNDDDFGIDGDGAGGIRQKRLPDGEIDRNFLHLFSMRASGAA